MKRSLTNPHGKKVEIPRVERRGGWVLPILLIPIEKDTGGGVEIDLVALLERAPAVLVGFSIQGHLSLCGMNDVV